MGADEGETSEEPSLGSAAKCARHLSTIPPLAADHQNKYNMRAITSSLTIVFGGKNLIYILDRPGTFDVTMRHYLSMVAVTFSMLHWDCYEYLIHLCLFSWSYDDVVLVVLVWGCEYLVIT